MGLWSHLARTGWSRGSCSSKQKSMFKYANASCHQCCPLWLPASCFLTHYVHGPQQTWFAFWPQYLPAKWPWACFLCSPKAGKPIWGKKLSVSQNKSIKQKTDNLKDLCIFTSRWGSFKGWQRIIDNLKRQEASIPTALSRYISIICLGNCGSNSYK